MAETLRRPRRDKVAVSDLPMSPGFSRAPPIRKAMEILNAITAASSVSAFVRRLNRLKKHGKKVPYYVDHSSRERLRSLILHGIFWS